MTTIDHRILIPAGPDAVWEYVSDITHNPDWQIDCAEVIFLTSRREGPGVRWRYSAPGGHEYVIAVTAWYNGLGYEYYYVDGVPYKENKGRIRLQEIPEGTIVQWTFTYELGGLLGGMRNSLGVSRNVDLTISESLKTLYQKIKQSGAAARPHESKSLMRDAPNVDARSAYQPRHPSVMEEDSRTLAPPSRIPAAPYPGAPRAPLEPPVGEGDGQRIRVIVEPPLAEDDTRRRKAAAAAAQVQPLMEDSIPLDEGEPDFLRQLVDFSRFEPPRAPTAVEEEPDFLKRFVEPPISPSDTQPRKPITPAEEAAPPVATVTSAPAPWLEPTPSAEDTSPVALPAAASPFAPPAAPEEPTAPTSIAPDDTQADTVTPARVYDWPKRETVEPEPPKTEPAMPAFEPPAIKIEPPPAPRIVETEPLAPAAKIEPAPPITPAFEAPAAEIKPEPVPTAKVEPPAPVMPAPTAQVEPPPVVQPKAASETASIWEIFGVQRPSEADTSAPAAPQPEAPAVVPTQPEPIAPAAPTPVVEQPAAVTPQPEPIAPVMIEPEPPIVAASAPVIEPPAAPPQPEPVVAISTPVVEASAPPEAGSALPSRITLPPAPTRAGLRLALRRKQIVVRRP